MDDKKNIEVVSGDGSEIEISPVYDHLNAAKPKSAKEKPSNIVIPKETTKKDEDKDEDEKKEEN